MGARNSGYIRAGSAAATVGGLGAARQCLQVAHLLWHAAHDASEVSSVGSIPVDMSIQHYKKTNFDLDVRPKVATPICSMNMQLIGN